MTKVTIVPKKRWWKRALLVTIYLIPLAAMSAFGAVYYKKYQDLKSQSPDQRAQSQVDQTLGDIGKLYALPTDEKPVVATVKDKDAYKKQYPNFGDAENGDVLVVYTKTQLAILYRPSQKRLVKVGPVSVQQAVAVIKVIGKESDRKQVETTLTAAKITAQDAGDAKASYTAPVVVDLSGKYSDTAKSIADTLKTQVTGTLPSGEDKPSGVDILVIAGSAATQP